MSFSEDLAKARERWDELRKTKYSDKDIRIAINVGRQASGSDYANEPYAQSCFQQAMAMIAYNEMVDNRIERAEKSWGIK